MQEHVSFLIQQLSGFDTVGGKLISTFTPPFIINAFHE